MSYNLDQKMEKTARGRRLFVAALVLGCAFGTVTNAAAQRITPPTTPAVITPPAGNSAFLLGHAVGTQGYVCLPKGTGASWTVKNARPEATLFRAFSGRISRSSPTSSAPIHTPTMLPQARYLSATRRGRVPSIAARCGHRSCIRIRSPPAPTRVVRMPAQLPASCCSQLVRNRGQQAAKSCLKPPSSNA